MCVFVYEFIFIYVPRGYAFHVEVGETQLDSFGGQPDDVEHTAQVARIVARIVGRV